jgi:putative ABC transport system substrate-binding protein
MNNRRKLLVALGAGALAAPLGSVAQQQGRVWRVGVLSARSRPDSLDADAYGAFQREMRALGYIEGKNLAIVWLFADGKFERLPGLAAELLLLNVDAIVTPSPFSTAAAQKATTTIPIVFVSVTDPDVRGFVKTLARPGGNITGLANLTSDITPKHLEMLLSIVPKLSRVAVLVSPTNPAHPSILKNVHRKTAKALGLTILQSLLISADKVID